MTRELLNTLYIGTQDTYAHLSDDNVVVKLESVPLIKIPIHHLGGLCTFGVVNLSRPLMAKCAKEGRTVAFFDSFGRFEARVEGKATGNILLRRDQWSAHFDETKTKQLASSFVAGKIQNARQVLLRSARDIPKYSDAFTNAAHELEKSLCRISSAETIEELRGIEGLAALTYFEMFDYMVLAKKTDFSFVIRSRRPPKDRVNALLSFLYSVATNDCVSALEGVGLDPQCGFLHVLRPGRPSLALDLIEEFRSILLDRLCLTLINRKEIQSSDFEEREGGSFLLSKEGRDKVLTAYQNRKKVEVKHSLLVAKVPIGLLPHLQARLLARTLRGDLDHYIPYIPV